jgi:hypothetical protein
MRSLAIALQDALLRPVGRRLDPGARATVDLEVTVYAPCKFHKRADGVTPQTTQFCGCTPKIVAHMKKRGDLSTIAMASLVQLNILATLPAALNDTSGTSRTLTPVNSAVTAPYIWAGTGATAPAVTDYQMQTTVNDSSHKVAATVNAISDWSGSSGSFTVTGTISNTSGGDITYKEIGIIVTCLTWNFLISHDTINAGSGYLVSNGGSLAVTETFTYSA